jgi:pimeloyl-ACP methyl ester carboxylesterase
MKQFYLILACLIFLPACANLAQPADESTAVLTDCQLIGGVDAQCGSITVPEDRSGATNNSRTIDIHFAVLPATMSNPDPDPIFMLAGGPGQAAIDTFPFILPALQKLNQKRDIVLVDQRGTGRSNPLACPNVVDLPPDSTEEMVFDALAVCREELAADNDLAQYHTTNAMTDLDEVRAALGYDQINLIGISYGSRAAQEYMRLFPEQTRSVVLDAVVGPELVLQLQAPQDGQRALDLFFARCATDDACQSTFPNLEQEFATLLAQTGDGMDVTVTDPVTGELINLTITRDDFMQVIFGLLYSPDLISLLPLLIHNAAESGDVGPILAQSLMLTSGTALHQGMFYSVVCSEDAPLIDLAAAEALQAETQFALVAEELLTVCADWPQTPVRDELREPVTAAIPTLLLSGNADPITPPHYADSVAATLPQSLHLVIPDYGHGMLTVGCVPVIVEAFISSGAVTGLDTSCLAEIQPPPFFVGLTGPRP